MLSIVFDSFRSGGKVGLANNPIKSKKGFIGLFIETQNYY